MCDYHHKHLEEEERLTTMVTTTGEKAQGEGCHYDTMTGSTIMVTTMQDRLQERFERKRTTTSSDYIIRLTDRLLRCGTKIVSCFSQKQLFFGYVGCFSGRFSAVYRHSTWDPLGTFSAVFQLISMLGIRHLSSWPQRLQLLGKLEDRLRLSTVRMLGTNPRDEVKLGDSLHLTGQH